MSDLDIWSWNSLASETGREVYSEECRAETITALQVSVNGYRMNYNANR